MYTIYFKVVSSLTKRRQLQTRLSTNTGYSIGCNRAYSLDSKMGACKFSISWKYFSKFDAAEPYSIWWFDLKLDTHYLDQLLFLEEDHKTILHLTRTGICSAVQSCYDSMSDNFDDIMDQFRFKVVESHQATLSLLHLVRCSKILHIRYYIHSDDNVKIRNNTST